MSNHYKSEKIIPYNSGESKKEQVGQMFDNIAPGYDRLNSVLSLGNDYFWRKSALSKLVPYQPKKILDIATGTGDFAILAEKILKPESIIGIDISEGMMKIGQEKVKEKHLESTITFEQQDCSNMSFPDDSFDAATVAFGVRNFEFIDHSFQEIHRVLKPKGHFLFMELATPVKFPMKQLYLLYAKYVIPTIGRLLSTEKNAYNYLPESIYAFPQGNEMIDILKKNGFKNVRYKTYTGGVCSLYIAEK